MYGVASQKHCIGQVRRFGALVHRIQCTSAPNFLTFGRCCLISFQKTWFYAFLVLFRFISFGEPSLLFAKKWNRISEDPSLVWRLQGSTRSHAPALRCSAWIASDCVHFFEWSQQDVSLLRVLVRCLKVVLKRFLLIPNFLETLLFKRLLLTFSPLINERLTRVEVRSSFDRFRFILVAWTAAVASCKMDDAIRSPSSFSGEFT